jgi:hypothetical protein
VLEVLIGGVLLCIKVRLVKQGEEVCFQDMMFANSVHRLLPILRELAGANDFFTGNKGANVGGFLRDFESRLHFAGRGFGARKGAIGFNEAKQPIQIKCCGVFHECLCFVALRVVSDGGGRGPAQAYCPHGS